MGTIAATLTAYWPYDVSPIRALLDDWTGHSMEGGETDRMGRPIYTLQAHQKDPATAPWVSCAGDPTVFADGQRLMIPALDASAVFRIVDTGGHFSSAFAGGTKVVRVAGQEPIDVAVQTALDSFGVLSAQVSIVDGDTFAQNPTAAQAVWANTAPGVDLTGQGNGQDPATPDASADGAGDGSSMGALALGALALVALVGFSS